MGQLIDNRRCVFTGLLGQQDKARSPLDGDQHGGAGFARMQQVGFPVPTLTAFLDIARPFLNRHAVFDVLNGLMLTPVPAALALATRQITPPRVVIGACYLCINKSIDGLVTDT